MQTIKCIQDYPIGNIPFGTILTEMPDCDTGFAQYKNEIGEIFYFHIEEIMYSDEFSQSFRLISNE
jgi:hypothetical protein